MPPPYAPRSEACDCTEFNAIFEAFMRDGIAICYRMGCANDSEDIMQNTRLHAWLYFDAGEEVANWPALLAAIARNRCCDHLNSQGPQAMPLDEASSVAAAGRSPDEVVEWRERQLAYQRIMLEVIVDPGDQFVLRLRLQGMRFKDIAHELSIAGSKKISESAIRHRWRGITQRLAGSARLAELVMG